MKFLALEYDTYTSHHKEPRPAIFIKTKAPANLVLTSSDEELQKIMRYFMLDETKHGVAVVVDQYRSDRRRSFRYSKQDHDDEPGESSSRDRGRPDPYMPDARRFVMVATTIQSQYEQDPAVAGVPLYSYVSIGLYTNDDYNPRCS
ncbi:hypothetical protein QE152_g30963 [Popillia japonica]|uniref:Uncharacterized protein n=1 Tax=Popillia japonica TaxID=7064 RepID=A0AAW1JD23_POPJA